MFNIRPKLKFPWHSIKKFVNIEGFNDVKEIISRALDTDENYNLILCGPPASSKTLFLLEIQEQEKKAIYFDASNTTTVF